MEKITIKNLNDFPLILGDWSIRVEAHDTVEVNATEDQLRAVMNTPDLEIVGRGKQKPKKEKKGD